MEGRLVAEQRHGRYFAQELMLDQSASIREQIQDALDAGERLEWHKGDLFAIPPWVWHSHENNSDETTIMFSVDDWPALSKLGFYRKEEAKP